MRKIVSVLAALLLIAALPVMAPAEAWVGVDFQFEAPEGMYQLGPGIEENDPAWALAGVGEAEGVPGDGGAGKLPL